MRVSVLGVGSIGTLFAALLSRTEHEIHLHGRGEHMAMIAKNGISLIGEEVFSVESQRFELTFDEAGIPSHFDGSADIVIIAGKSSSLDNLCNLASKLLKTDGIAFAITNGLGNVERLCHQLGMHRVVYASTTHGANIATPSTVRWAGRGKLHLANTVVSQNEKLNGFKDSLISSGINCEIVEDGRSLVWNKVLINIAINPLAAMAGVENGELLGAEMFANAVFTMIEGANVARAEQIDVGTNQQLEDNLRQVLLSTASNSCSMLEDVKAGATTEISVLNREIVNRGEKLGISTPLNNMLASIIELITP
jgi:2-dehydropantoate 2-reductase|tara:strand:+ start:1581 stop:2507 length:927 start_codon:yes stop_codon:yes gene_type:complete